MKQIAQRLVFFIFAIVLALPVMAQETASQPKLTLISNVNIFDGKSDKLLMNMHVLVKDNLIDTISVEPLAVIQTENITMIDGNGRTLMPGLIDGHWHTTYAELPLDIFEHGDMPEVIIRAVIAADHTLMRGYTTVRDVGGNPFSLKKMIDSDDIPGPRIYPSGPPISQTAGHFDFRDKNSIPVNPGDNLDYWQRNSLLMTADGVPEVTKRVREALRMGAVHIKLAAGGGTTSQFDPLDVAQYTFEEIKAAVDVASTWNTYVTVHAYTPTAINTALDAGVRVIEHGQLLDDKTMERIAKEGVWVALQPFIVDDDSLYSPNPITAAKQRQMVKGTVQAYELARKHKVKVAFGTDILFNEGPPNYQNLMITLLERFDYTPYEALKMVTYDNAQLLKLTGPRNPYPGDLGVIAEGAYADLLLVKGNPLEDLKLIEDPDKNFDLIMKSGKIYKNAIQ